MKIACSECRGTGQVPDYARPGEQPQTDCPFCSATGLEDVSYAVYGHGDNGDGSFRELYNVSPSLTVARGIAEDAMRNRHENVLEDGTPTLEYMTIEGPGTGEDEGPVLEIGDPDTEPTDVRGKFTWSGRTDEQIADALRRIDQAAGTELLDSLTIGTHFKLGREAGRAYRSEYVKNDQSMFDQIKGTCESPYVYNMSSSSLAFAVPFNLLKEALA